jgi:hypothetical protein
MVPLPRVAGEDTQAASLTAIAKAERSLRRLAILVMLLDAMFRLRAKSREPR